MSYVAIARKWRPLSFEQIAGQGHVTRTLSNAIRLGRIHHAFLFTGARGVGKTTAARTLARCLSCETDGPRPDPCGECPSCKEILAGSSPDVIEIDGASNNSVDDVRDLRESVRYLPQRSRYKVYIVDEVHMLSKGAFNALLKTLEEPPPHVVFIFATTEPQKIPDTILSRVQRFDFKRIPLQVVSDYLANICEAESVRIPADALRLIARAGEGSMRDSQSLLDQVISFAGNDVSTDQVAEILGLVDRKLLYDMLEGMLRGQADRCLDAIDQVYGYGYDLSEFTADMLELLRNATLVGLSKSSRRYVDVPDDEAHRLGELAADVAPEVLVRSFEVMLDVHEQVSRAPRPRLVLEMAVARLVMIRPARPLDQIVHQLADMERRLRHGGSQARPRDNRHSRSSGGAPPPRDDDEPHPAPGAPLAQTSPSPVTGQAAHSAPPPTRGSLALAPPPPADDDLPPLPEPDGSDLRPSSEPRRAPAAPPPVAPSSINPPQTTSPRSAPPHPPTASAAPGSSTSAPPRLPPEATDEQRFHVLRQWLRDGGLGFDLFAKDAVFIAARPPELHLGFRKLFQARQARRKANHDHLRDGVRRCFPGCTTVVVEVIEGGSGPLSLREADKEALAARVVELQAELTTNPLAARLRTVLGATLDDVRPDAQVRAAAPEGLAELLDDNLPDEQAEE